MRAAVLLLIAVAGAAAGAGPQVDGSFRRYLELLEAYRSGSPNAVVRALGDWKPGHAAEGARLLLEAWKEAPPGQAAAFVGLAQAAVPLHTELSLAAADRGDGVEHERQVLALRRLLRRLRDDGGGGEIPARDLHLAAASAELAAAAPVAANTLLVELFAADLGRPVPPGSHADLAEYPSAPLGLPETIQVGSLVARHLAERGDAEMLLLAGCAQESLASMLARSRPADRGPRTRDALRRSEAFLRAALEVAPHSAEARLRLGRVLMARGRLDEARPLLGSVTEDGSPRQAYLAWLFLGDLLGRRGDSRAAIAAFEDAVRRLPEGRAARLSLARAREPLEGYAAAREVLRSMLVGHTADPGPGPWLQYAAGPEELRLHPLERLRGRVRRR